MLSCWHKIVDILNAPINTADVDPHKDTKRNNKTAKFNNVQDYPEHGLDSADKNKKGEIKDDKQDQKVE